MKPAVPANDRELVKLLELSIVKKRAEDSDCPILRHSERGANTSDVERVETDDRSGRRRK